MSSIRFIKNALSRYPPRKYVVEFGGLIPNEQIRALFEGSQYTRITLDPTYADVEPNIIRNILTYAPTIPPDTIICHEILQHTRYGEAICKHAYNILQDGGLIVVVCAADPRMPHSWINGSCTLDNNTWYKNIHPGIMRHWLKPFKSKYIVPCYDDAELYAVARKDG
jgi:hypothetical protein